jgi:hypothetical protein
MIQYAGEKEIKCGINSRNGEGDSGADKRSLLKRTNGFLRYAPNGGHTGRTQTLQCGSPAIVVESVLRELTMRLMKLDERLLNVFLFSIIHTFLNDFVTLIASSLDFHSTNFIEGAIILMGDAS